MNKRQRKDIAESTLLILEQGGYVNNAGERIDLSGDIEYCIQETQGLTPRDMKSASRKALQNCSKYNTWISLANESTMDGATHLLNSDCPRVGVLSFASANNPGGGFLRGSAAQEESLARSSALYACLLAQTDFYEAHQSTKSLYTHRAVISKRVPFFRDDQGALLDAPYFADIVTCPAPSARALNHTYFPESVLMECFRERIHLMLGAAIDSGIRHMVLGAWGCGAFGNSPCKVAIEFAELLGKGGDFFGAFESIRFSVLDQHGGTLRAFEEPLSEMLNP